MKFTAGNRYRISNNSDYMKRINGSELSIEVLSISTDPVGYHIKDLSGKYSGISHWESVDQYDNLHDIIEVLKHES